MGLLLRTRSNSDTAQPSRDLREGLITRSEHRQSEKFFASLTWVTPLIVGVNIIVFAIMVVTFRTAAGFNPVQLAVWGANSGTLDLSGEWWRLFTYQFLHANLLHIVVNMLVLWNVGRLTERLYGSVTLLFLYLASGALAGFASVVWNPAQVSVGASGSIFGVVGAFLAFLSRSRNDVPSSVVRYWVPALIFSGYNLFAGATQPGIDNAAHVGGLVAGFCLGIILARPLDSRRSFPLAQVVTAVLFAGACALPPLWYLGAFNHRPTPMESFAASHRWYMDGEGKNLLLWQTLAMQIGAGTISNDEAANRFERDIVPFWKDANARLQGELSKQPEGEGNPLLRRVADFAMTRSNWAQAVVTAMRVGSPERMQALLTYAQQNVLDQAAIDRLKLRDEADSLPAPLAESAPAAWIKSMVPGLQWHCVDPPAFMRKVPSSTDATSDGPAQRHAIGCLAQRLFLAGDYATLDAMMRTYSRNLSDLPDGTSRLEGMWQGLDDLFAYGQIAVEEAMRRESEWRRSVKGAVAPDIIEVMILHDWAYAARGHGYASSVTPQAMQLYLLRSAMAAAGLRDTAASAAKDPMWYVLSLAVDRDQSIPIERQRVLFDQGIARFPGYMPLYRQMLTSLMPRWGGSTNAVDSFIRDASKANGQIDAATYARLYLIYGNLEGDDYNSLESSSADTAILKQGVDSLRKRYPNSDYITNAVARFKCIDNDVPAYRALRPSLEGHQSVTAWPDKMSVASCDKFAS